MSDGIFEYDAENHALIFTERVGVDEIGAAAIVGHGIPPWVGFRLIPTPEQIDDLLAALSGTGHASECVELVERWIEQRLGIVGGTSHAWGEEYGG